MKMKMKRSALRISLVGLVLFLAGGLISAGCGTDLQQANPYTLLVGVNSFDHTQLMTQLTTTLASLGNISVDTEAETELDLESILGLDEETLTGEEEEE